MLSGDAFYGVRVAAADSLGELNTSAAMRALIGALGQPDSRVRTAAAAALGELHGDPDSYAALAQSLRRDPSYAVRAAAARSIGKSGLPPAFELLRAAWLAKPEIHVASSIDAALAATGDPRAAVLLLSDARPGTPVRLRIAALSALPGLRTALEPAYSQELTDLVSTAMRDSYLPLEMTAEELVVTLHLAQLEPQLVAHAASAPTLWQRELGRKLVQQLRAQRPTNPSGEPRQLGQRD